MQTGVTRELERQEEQIHTQAALVNKLMHESIANGNSSKGKAYEGKQAEAQKILDIMQTKYQKGLNKAIKTLRKV